MHTSWAFFSVFRPHKRWCLALALWGIIWSSIPGKQRIQAENNRAAAPDIENIITLLDLVLDADETTARRCLGILTNHLQSGSAESKQLEKLKNQLARRLKPILEEKAHPLQFDAAALATSWKDPQAVRIVRQSLADTKLTTERRIAALNALVMINDSSVLDRVEEILSQPQDNPAALRGALLASLSKLRRPEVAHIVLSKFDQLEPELRPRALELLTQRPNWSRDLLTAIQKKQIEKDAVNLNQLRRMATFKDKTVQTLLKEIYGTIRTGRNPNRAQVFYKMRDFLRTTPGDPIRGEQVFKKLCGQCHKIHGSGADVGPDISRNGRNDWDQLLWNVFDPSQVIGKGYQARILVTSDGRTLTGLPVEESDQKVVLKLQGGKTETIPRDQIEVYKLSEVSMMPDELEKQLKPQELADLFSFLAFDKHPNDPKARRLPGAP